MYKIIKQLMTLYWKLERKKKIVLFAILIFLVFSFFWLLKGPSYTPLSNLSVQECKQIEGFFAKEGIAYRKRGEQEILVPERERVRAEDRLDQLFHEERYRGLELFDTHTWMKGEKELQMLEMRALKGELERDLSSFDNIADATVILDLVPPKLFGQTKYKTKASVILTVQEGCEISLSQLRAITYHLSGAVRGLEPNMIAISDTSGRLYKGMQQEGEESFFNHSLLCDEERLTEKINRLLVRLVGKGNFYLDLTLGKEKSIVALMIKEEVGESEERAILENQIRALLAEREEEVVVVIDFLPLKKGAMMHTTHSLWPFTALAFGLLTFTLVFLMGRGKKNRHKREGIDMEKLANLIKDQDPKTIALMFSYLETEKAERLLGALPYPVQKRVALHLPGLEGQ